MRAPSLASRTGARRWVTLYNANVDRNIADRHTPDQLRRELQRWEAAAAADSAASSFSGNGAAGKKKAGVEDVVAYQVRLSLARRVWGLTRGAVGRCRRRTRRSSRGWSRLRDGQGFRGWWRMWGKAKLRVRSKRTMESRLGGLQATLSLQTTTRMHLNVGRNIIFNLRSFESDVWFGRLLVVSIFIEYIL